MCLYLVCAAVRAQFEAHARSRVAHLRESNRGRIGQTGARLTGCANGFLRHVWLFRPAYVVCDDLAQFNRCLIACVDLRILQDNGQLATTNIQVLSVDPPRHNWLTTTQLIHRLHWMRLLFFFLLVFGVAGRTAFSRRSIYHKSIARYLFVNWRPELPTQLCRVTST